MLFENGATGTHGDGGGSATTGAARGGGALLHGRDGGGNSITSGGGKSPRHRRRCRLQCSRGSSDLLNSRGKQTDMTYTRGRSSWRPRARNRLGSVALWKLQFVLICTGDDRMRACFAFPPGKHRVYTHNVYVLECAGGELGVFYFSLSLSLHPSLSVLYACIHLYIYISFGLFSATLHYCIHRARFHRLAPNKMPTNVLPTFYTGERRAAAAVLQDPPHVNAISDYIIIVTTYSAFSSKYLRRVVILYNIIIKSVFFFIFFFSHDTQSSCPYRIDFDGLNFHFFFFCAW